MKDNNAYVNRDQVIVRTSVIGIVANVFLAAFKAAVGFISGSIAIVLDAVNNISDAASSVITILGTKLASRNPDSKHPFGHGRIEYLTSMVIAVLVLYAGVTSLVESIKAIIHPEKPSYTIPLLIIVSVAIIVKIVLGRYVKSIGKKVNSDSLVNSGEDATLDSIISLTTLIAAIIFMILHVSLEAWLGAVIAIVIIKSGIEMLSEAFSQITGEAVSSELANDIKNTINQIPGVEGTYDLILNNYGPDRYIGSTHIAVSDTMTASELDVLERRITEEVVKEHGIVMAGISVYALNTQNPEYVVLEKRIQNAVFQDQNITELHGLNIDTENKVIRFDIVISLDVKDRTRVFEEAVSRVKEAVPDYELLPLLDTDYAEGK